MTETQGELIRKEKLAVLGQLSGSVGHELRNPLGVINNALYFLKTVLSGSDENIREYLNIIKAEVDNSERIISDLLDFSRTKTPQMDLITVNELINQAILKCSIPGTVIVRIDIPETLPSVGVDPFQMAQVFQNLITNAVQAMPEGGELRIVGAIHESPLPGFVEISVTDTGEGISPVNMKKLFQPLFTTKTKGIGLGLVVCRNLVEANGGSIRVECQFGKGSTFTVILPSANNS